MHGRIKKDGTIGRDFDPTRPMPNDFGRTERLLRGRTQGMLRRGASAQRVPFVIPEFHRPGGPGATPR